jgi:hypothetical protein
MKQFLKSALCTALLLSPCVTQADFSGASGSNSNFANFSNSPIIAPSPRCGSKSGCGTSRRFSNNFSGRRRHSGRRGCSDDCSRSRSRSKSSNSSCLTNCGLGYVHYRSQGANTARELVGWQTEINKYGVGQPYGAITLLYEYTRSFKSKRIARDLFGTDRLDFEGSAITTNRRPNALIADLFGLPSTFSGSIRIRPRIQNHIFELDGYWAFDDCSCWNGFWFRFHAPVVHTRWKLGLNHCDNILTATFQPFPLCTFSTSQTTTQAPSVISALTGNFAVNGQRFLCSGLFPACARKKTRLADIDLLFGYNFVNNECSHFGIFLMLVLPTGNKPNGDHIFQPIVGNGRHFELGAGFTGHTLIWDDGCNQSLYLYGEGNVTHMFKNRQCRLLDFCNNGPFSRYLLLREFQADGLTPTGNVVSATCFNRRNVNVRIDVKGDASFKLAYRWCGWGFDVGYNVYGHSREKVRLGENCSPCSADIQKLGIAGTNGVCCFTFPTVPSATTGCNAISGASTGTSLINATFSTSNAFTPTVPSGADRALPVPSLGATSVCLVAGQTPPVVGTLVPTNNATCTAVTPILAPVSSRPVLVTVNDLDPRSAQACAVLTNKVFGHVAYYWADDCGWCPHVGVGAEGEFRSNNSGKAGLNQWGVWLKGGCSF